MAKVKTIKFERGTHLTFLVDEQHGRIHIRIYPTLFSTATKKIIPPEEFKKSDMIGHLRFEDHQAIEGLASHLDEIREAVIGGSPIHKFQEDLDRIISNIVRNAPKSNTINKNNLGVVPDEVLDDMIERFTNEKQRRVPAEKEKVKEQAQPV